MKSPFVHTFSTSEGYYLYDVNTNTILSISEKVYRAFEKDRDMDKSLKNDPDTFNELSILKKQGYLKDNRVETSVHPETEFLKFYYKSYLNTLILQVTQNCNLRCDYCIYSGSYNNRIHTNKRMTFETATKGIDFLVEHASDCKFLNITFYGGEPLIEIDLIKKCMSYVSENYGEKEVSYSLTTNATLLNKDIVEFFVKHDVSVVISLDGPKEIHNNSRHFLNNRGSFDLIMKNIRYIKENYPNYYNTKLSYNTVLNVENGFSVIDDFVSNNELLTDSLFSTSIINPNYSKKRYSMSETYLIERRYEDLKVFLNAIGRLPDKSVSKIAKLEFDTAYSQRESIKYGTRYKLPQQSHHSGPCVPGTFRLFLTVEGNFYPCERVSETSNFTKLGTLETGLDIVSGERMLNIEKFSSDKCRNCWAYTYCEVCVACIDDTNGFSNELLEDECKKVKFKTEEKLKDYSVISRFK